MSFSMVPIEVKDQIVAHLPLSARMSLRQCSRIDRYVVTISPTVVEKMIIQRHCVLVKSLGETQIITQSYEGNSYEVWQSIFNEKLNNFIKIVANRLRVKNIVLQDANEATFNFIRQLNWDRIGYIDLVPSSPEDLSRFFDVIGNREFNIQLEHDADEFLDIEQIYEAQSLKLVCENTFDDEDMETFENLRRFESNHPGELTMETLKTFIRRWIEKREAVSHYFHLDTNRRIWGDPKEHLLHLDELFEGLEVQKYSVNNGILLIEKSNSEVGRLSHKEDFCGKIEICFVTNIQVKSESDCEIFSKIVIVVRFFLNLLITVLSYFVIYMYIPVLFPILIIFTLLNLNKFTEK